MEVGWNVIFINPGTSRKLFSNISWNWNKVFLNESECFQPLDLLTWSLSSVCPRSLPLAWAILFPDTKFPTITEAGPISAAHGQNPDHHPDQLQLFLPTGNRRVSPGCFCRGLGRLVTQVWGHIRTLQGCSPPSRYSCLISDRWMPPSGVLGRVLAGTRARQNTPTPWMLSMAWRGADPTKICRFDPFPFNKDYYLKFWGAMNKRWVCLTVAMATRHKKLNRHWQNLSFWGSIRSVHTTLFLVSSENVLQIPTHRSLI